MLAAIIVLNSLQLRTADETSQLFREMTEHQYNNFKNIALSECHIAPNPYKFKFILQCGP